jgi:uncharacterized tellurite resistance protein B-like protein
MYKACGKVRLCFSSNSHASDIPTRLVFEVACRLCHDSFMSILRLLKINLDGNVHASSETETVRKIIRELDQLEPERAKFIAAFAYLLSRAARADLDISLEEIKVMERIVMQLGGLPEEQAVIVIQMAKTQNILFGGTENFLVSREFNSVATHKEKMGLLDCLYAVASADQSISTIEDNEISQIADELRIEHHDFIRIRSKYRDKLAVLKDSQRP